MARQYNSKRREESAKRTRLSIVEAAVKLHGEGVMTLSAVAEEAGVSLPTVNKYFPTREDLFDACTLHMADQLEVISTDILLAIDDPGERLHRVVQEVYNLHQITFGQSWTGYVLEDESSAMDAAMEDYEGIVATLADTLNFDNSIGDEDEVRRFVRAALSPLTHRALRLKNGLDQADAVEYMAVALAGVLNIKM